MYVQFLSPLVTADWSLDETFYLVNLAREYELSWYAMADAYSFSNDSITKKSVTEIKRRMHYLFEMIPQMNLLLAYPSERTPLLSIENQWSKELNDIGRLVDASLQSVIDAQRRLVKKFSGDLFSVPQAFIANAALPFWPHIPQNTSASNVISRKMSKKKKSAIISTSPTNSTASSLLKHRPSLSGGTGPSSQFESASGSTSRASGPLAVKKHDNMGVIKPSLSKEKNWSLGATSAYLRSQRLKPIRVGITKIIERQLIEQNIGMVFDT